MTEGLRDGHSEDRYFRILDTAPDAMVVVARGEQIAFVNAQAEKLFGYSRAELLGKRLEVLIPERFRVAHGGHVGRYFDRPGTRPMGSGLQLFGRRADGSEVAIEVSLSPVRIDDSVLVSAAIRDVTERRQIEAAVKLNADRLVSAVDSIQDAFALFDAEGRLAVCNPEYRRLLGDSSEQLLQRSQRELAATMLGLIAFSGDEERERFMEHLEQGADSTRPIDVHTRDGRSLRIMSRRTVEGGLVQTIWDLTSDVLRERELGEARAAAEAGSAAKSEFLSSMSHELRTPMNAILGFAQLLQRDKQEPLSERHRERVQHILRGGEHLLRLIDDILDLSCIEAGVVSISTEAVSVMEVLEELEKTLGPMATRDGIRLQVEPASVELPMVAVDRTRYAQILMNFASNAIKYNRPRGSVSLSVSTPSARVVRVTVSDTGIGIAADKQGSLFQPFQRAGQETGSIEGTGIGLVITKRLAELMQGAVGFSSAAGEGSAFWVDVPAHAWKARSSAPPSMHSAADLGLARNDRRLVLYVEDNPANVTFMKDLLSSFDSVDLVSMPTAEMGVEFARARRPDVIILDINLPGMSGFDALALLRKWPETLKIPVIALTAAASERDQQRGEQAGFYRYLTKPLRVEDLITALEALALPASAL